ncbi:sensor histidine kinase [Finegoldia magna]|uniref:sensor histidine kinase n=1 Tax=Finegoldia magna TaxID=1260 RepID=UPI001CE11DD8|nr:HAMP domain-containing sensor histidine kinase [Finegoldia magna]MCA5587073.1 HAMP domain-containing histidine kinase [Finegoldia magna]
MRKENSYIKRIILYQCLLIAVVIFLTFAFHRLIDSLIVYNIDTEAEIDSILKYYFQYSNYVFIMICAIFIIIGCFYIQAKEFEKYREYFVSGIKYIKGEIPEIREFHESLSNERIDFINIRKLILEMENNYELAYKEKTDLLTYLAHDIKTPLSNLLGYTTLLYDEDNLTNEQKRKFVKVIYENVKSLNSLSEDFFSYLKFNLNEIPINIKKFDVELFLKQWEEERKALLNDNILDIRFEDTSDKEIGTDPELLVRILDNLVSNATKYSKKGSTIIVKVEIQDKALNLTVKNEVENNLNVDWKLVKNKFYRGDMSRSRIKNNGSGVGLTIVNDIVTHLNGEFYVCNKDNLVIANVNIPVY